MDDNRALKYTVIALSVAFAAFHLYTAAFGSYAAHLQRSVHLAFAVVLGFLVYPASKDGKVRWYDIILAALAAVSFGYIAFKYEEIALRQSLVTPLSSLDIVMGILVIVLLLEITRRSVGLVLSIVAVVFAAYVLAGPYLPDLIAHRGFSLVDLIDYQVFGLDGIYSIPMSTSATYIVLFIILGTLMEFNKTGDVMMDIGKALAGRYRGGSAKVACVSSALFGSISGSAAANVYATGTFTIPMMKKIGYSPAFAGAVEAVASTGGQLMPPVMGASAFLMAELLGVPYIQICKIALIPALLYYSALFFVLDFEAAKLGIKGMDKDELPTWRCILPRAYLLLPLVFLIVVLMNGFTPFRAAFLGIIATIVLSFFSKETRFTLSSFTQALAVSAKRTVMIAAACGAAGIVIGAITLTGFGLSLSSIIISLSRGSQILALLLVMLSAIVMGMGTPTTVAYIVVSTMAVPVMKNLGYPTMASHMFVFYYAVLSMITPPVALAAYAAADIAKEDSMKIGFTAMKIGLITFTIPFAFLFDPPLLMQGVWWEIALRFATTLVGAVAFAGAATGWFGKKLGWLHRALFFVAFGLVIAPGWTTTIIGLALTAALWLVQHYLNLRGVGESPTA
ncbi:MAG: TRAP transporter fused permease subunit [Clostridia bacterium]|nr:TRAP transporter fused permease subunit [Clostridia bacterium]